MSADFREIGAALSSDLASQYQHYWTVNLGHRGVVRQGEFVSSFESSGQHRRTLSVGSHRPSLFIKQGVCFTLPNYNFSRPTFYNV